MAEAKVQEITPVYTIIEPATIPIRSFKASQNSYASWNYISDWNKLYWLDIVWKGSLYKFEE